MGNKNNEKRARPFLKWAGGKKQVINCIDKILPQEIKDSEAIENYFEPFLGGGAIFFHLVNKYTVNNAYLADINKELILTWRVIQNKPKKLISRLEKLSNSYLELSQDERKKFYYDIRDEKFNKNLKGFDYTKLGEDQIVRASQMIFLNRTCFNGLYRVNKSGKFNVPMGKYKNPSICDKENILKVHKKLKGVNIVCEDYHKSAISVDENSFFYLDPPYLPIKKTSFTSYDSSGFGIKEQIELSKFCKKLDENDVKFILSNSDPKNHDPNCDFFKNAYGNLGLSVCNHKKIEVRRSINSKGHKRGPINELLIYNY